MNCRTCSDRNYDTCIKCPVVLRVREVVGKEHQLTFIWHGRTQLKGGATEDKRNYVLHSLAMCK